MSAYPKQPLRRRARLLAGCALAAVLANPAFGQAVNGTPTTVVGNVSYNRGVVITGGQRDTVTVNTKQSVVSWAMGAGTEYLAQGNELVFRGNPNNVGNYTVLNRIAPSDPSQPVAFNGLVQSYFDTGYGQPSIGGNVWFYSPSGIVAGATSRFDVGSLVLTANNIDITGGLFGDGTNSEAGTIRFRGATDSRAAVTIMPGAQLNAASNYVAIVAPRVNQGGAITVAQGSAALVAAEAADVTIPVAGGLFDIGVTIGSNVAASGDTTLTHTGSTTVQDLGGSNQARRVYVMAAPKNTAITMLVSGTLGYDAASQAVASNGTIVLVAGQQASVISDQPNFGSGPISTTTIRGATFRGDTLSVSEHTFIDATTSSSLVRGGRLLTNGNGTTVTAANGFSFGVEGTSIFAVGPTAITARNGGTINFGQDVTAGSDLGGGSQTGETITVTADNGTINAGGNLILRSTRRGGDANDDAGSGTGGIVTVDVKNGGALNVATLLSVESLGFGGESSYGMGGDGFGGAASLLASAGGQVQANTIQVYSNGQGGRGAINGTGKGGNGTGGAATLAANGGIVTAVDSIEVRADGGGGQGNGDFGGIGRGGTATVQAVNASQIDAQNSIGALASGFGGDAGYGGGGGGAGLGGTASLALGANSAVETSFVQLIADGNGSFSNDFDSPGGSGTGGLITVSVDGSRLRFDGFTASARGLGQDSGAVGTGGTINFTNTNSSSVTGLGGNFQLDVTGTAGDAFGSAQLQNGTGGTITFVNTASTFTLSEGSLFATADGLGGRSDSFAPITGRGGTINFTINTVDPNNANASFQVSSLNLKADGYIGRPEEDLRDTVRHGTSGTGVGGSATLTLTGGIATANSVDFSASGTGDNGDFGNKAGAGYSGKAELRLTGGQLTAGAISIVAQAAGGDGAFGESGYGGGAAGNGGDANVGTNPFGAGAGAYVTGTGGTLRATSLTVSANGRGGFGGDGQTNSSTTPVGSGAGGSARGGTASIVTTGVSLEATNLTLTSAGQGGDGGEVNYPSGYGSQTANAGNAGDGFGGIATISLTGGAQSFESVGVSAEGGGGAGGVVSINGTVLTTATGKGGNGGIGAGGQASVSFINTTVTSEEGLRIDLTAQGNGGFGGFGPAGGSGGDATGGTASLTFNNSSTDDDVRRIQIEAFANAGGASSGSRLNGGNGGSATGGTATFTVTGGAIVTIADADQGDPLFLRATAFAGDGGSGGSQASNGRGGDGGDGGSATGGNATITVDQGARLTAPGLGDSESNPPSLFASADAGDGGLGGNGTALGNSGGIGGDGRSATAGNATINITGGRADFGNIYIEAIASRGNGGSGGLGAPDPVTGSVTGAASGSFGYAAGGQFKLIVDDSNGVAGKITAEELAFDLTGDNEDGGIEIADTGTLAGGGIRFASLFAQSNNFNNLFTPLNSDYLIRSTARRIVVDGDVQLAAQGNTRFEFSGTGGIDIDGDLNASSLTQQVLVTHDQQTSPLTASIAARNIRLQSSNGVEAREGSLLKASDSIGVFSNNNSVLVSNAIAINQIDIEALGDVTVGSLTAGDANNTGSIFVRAGATEGFFPSNVNLNGNIRSTGNIDVFSGADTFVNAGAQVVADRRLQIAAGDDILINAGALLRAANDAPPETGYGSDDPLNQQSQLTLFAGELYRFDGGDGDLGSIVIDGGTLEAPDRTIFMSANAVSGTNSTLNGGNLYVRLFNIPEGDQVPANDGGLLTGACLEGSVCLGQVNVNNIVRIGEDDYVPINLRLNGGIDARDVLLRGLSVQFGEAGAANVIRASEALTIESLGTGLVLNGPLAITGGTDVARVAASGSITGAQATIEAPNTLDLYATNNVTLGGVGATTIRTVAFDGNVVNAGGITVPGTIAIGDVRSGTDLALNAGGNITLDTMAVTGRATLRAFSGAIAVATDADATNGVDATGRSVSLHGLDGLSIIQATATAGDIALATDSGTLSANRLHATEGIALASGGGVGFGELRGENITITSVGDTVGNEIFAQALSVNNVGSFDVNRVAVNFGAVDVSADTRIRIGDFAMSRPSSINLVSIDGSVAVSGGELGSQRQPFTGAFDALGRSVSINVLGQLDLRTVVATGGDVELRTEISGALTVSDVRASGNVTIDQNGAGFTDGLRVGSVTAGGSVNLQSEVLHATINQGTIGSNLTIVNTDLGIVLGDVAVNGVMVVTTPGTVTIKGRAAGRDMTFTSTDLTIGDEGQLGDNELTQQLTLTSTADRLFLGSATGTGYRIDETEFTKIASRGNISIVSSPSAGRQDTAFNLLDPSGTNIVIGSMIFDGSQLGREHTLSITSPQSIGFVGNVQFRNFNNDQTVSYRATNDISLAAETGLVTIRNRNGGLAGTLILDAQQVHAMSVKARSEIAGLQLNEVRQRLGTNDQLTNDDGYFQANRIIVRIGRLLFIQNSGINSDDKNDKRGFSTNDLTIETGYGAGQVVIHGKIGNIVGEGIIQASHLNGTFDPQSGFNTCLIQVACSGTVEPPPPPTPDFSSVLSSSRDQVKSEQDEDDKEEALQAAQARPDPIIQFVDAPKSRFDPLIDEPVTGAGNEDYWEPVIPTTPGPTL
jgi:hypothetical protein